MPESTEPFVIQTAAHLRLLNSASRMAVFSAMEFDDPCTAADLASRVSLRPEAIHYHLRALETIGLVREVGSRATGRRPQTLFQRIVRRILLRPARETAAYQRERLRGCRLLLARSTRDVSAALAPRARSAPAPAMPPRVTRDDVRLSAKNLKTLTAKLAEIDAFLRSAHDARQSTRISVTIVVAPIASKGAAGSEPTTP